MMNTNITNVRAELYKLASSCIKYNNVININTKEGNVIMMSEEDYNSLMESLYLGVLESYKYSQLKKAEFIFSQILFFTIFNKNIVYSVSRIKKTTDSIITI